MQARPTNHGFRETRNTRHESRPSCFSRITASLPTISHHFPRFPGISRPPPPPLRRSSVHVSRRPPFLVSRPDCRAAPPGHCFPARCGAAMARHGRPPSPAPATRPFLFTGRQIFLLERTSLHFSPRGEVKCVRGPSGRGAHGARRRFTLSTKQAQRSLGGRIACFYRRVVRNAG